MKSLLVLAAVLAGCGTEAASTPSSSPPALETVTPSASAASSGAPAPTPTQPLPAPTETVSREPVPALGWREVASFAGTDMTQEASGVTFAGDQFVAVGWQYDFSSGSPGSVEGRVWLSPDGTSWEAVPVDPVFKDARLTGIIAARDGTLIATGWVHTATPMPDAIPVYLSWSSTDGRTWRRSQIDSLERGVLPVDGVVDGRQGYVLRGAHDLSLGTGPTGGELWHSRDGLSWEVVYETDDERIISLGAGDEGFVAVRYPGDGTASTVFASGDGQEWFDGATLPEELRSPSLGSLRGDWVMVGRGLEGPPAEPGPVTPGVYELPVWVSANGLAWQSAASIRYPGDGLGFAGPGPLVSIGDRLFLTPYAAGGGPRLSPAGVWSSVDGRTWDVADIRADVTIVDGAEHDGTVVLVGFVGPGQGVTIWVNERGQ